MRDLPLNALRAFAAVYETGGVRPAARALRVSHSSISRHVRELETFLGLALLEERGPRRAAGFTAQGEALGRAALGSLRDLDHAVSALRERRRPNAVVIATTASVAARWLLPRLAALQEAHPWIEPSVTVEQALVDPGDQGADVAIRMGSGPWPGSRCRALMDDTLYPVMHPAFWERAGRPAEPGRLAGLPLLHDRDPNASWDAWFAAFPAGRGDLRAGPRFASSDLVLRAAAQGLGVALARGRLAADDLASGALMRPFADRCVELPDAYWIVEPPAPPRAAVAAATAWLIAAAARPVPG
jgi:LysR family glycine cleavage system transcriptional activator